MPANTGARCWKNKKWSLLRKQSDKQTNYAGINKPVDGLSSCGLPCHFWPTLVQQPPFGSRGEITQQVKVSNTFFHFNYQRIMEQTSLSNNRLSKSLKTAKSTCEYANIRDQCAQYQGFLKLATKNLRIKSRKEAPIPKKQKHDLSKSCLVKNLILTSGTCWPGWPWGCLVGWRQGRGPRLAWCRLAWWRESCQRIGPWSQSWKARPLSLMRTCKERPSWRGCSRPRSSRPSSTRRVRTVLSQGKGSPQSPDSNLFTGHHSNFNH